MLTTRAFGPICVCVLRPGPVGALDAGARPALCWLPRALFKTPGLAGAAAGSCGERVL